MNFCSKLVYICWKMEEKTNKIKFPWQNIKRIEVMKCTRNLITFLNYLIHNYYINAFILLYEINIFIYNKYYSNSKE